MFSILATNASQYIQNSSYQLARPRAICLLNLHQHKTSLHYTQQFQEPIDIIRHSPCALLKDQIKATFVCNNPTRRATTFCRMSIGFMFTCTFKHFELSGCLRDLSTLAFRDEKMHYNKYLPVLRTFCCGLIDCDKYQRKCHRIGTRIWGLLLGYTHFIFLRYLLFEQPYFFFLQSRTFGECLLI